MNCQPFVCRGLPGATGPPGGAQGIAGAEGILGPTGATGGLLGEIGPTGIDGATGGILGSAGVVGPTGPSGVINQGVVGQLGVTGLDGATGPSTLGLFAQLQPETFALTNTDPTSIISTLPAYKVGQMGYPTVSVGDTYYLEINAFGENLDVGFQDTILYVSVKTLTQDADLVLFSPDILFIPTGSPSIIFRFQAWMTFQLTGELHVSGIFTHSSPSQNIVQVGDGYVNAPFTGDTDLLFDIKMKSANTSSVTVNGCNLKRLF
jgi:hypothetical protein